MAGLTPATELLHGLIDSRAQSSPDAPALRDRSRDRTYSEMSTRVWKLAGALRDLGLQPGDRVAGWLPPGGDEVHALFAVSVAGGVYVPVDSRLKAAQMRHVLHDCGARMLVTQGLRLAAMAKLAADLPELKCVLGAGRSATRPLQQAQAAVPVISMSEVRASANPADPAPVRGADDEAIVLYSGTATGLPAGRSFSHAEVLLRAEDQAGALGLRPDDTVLSLLDTSIRPGLDVLSAALAAGAQLMPEPPPGPEGLLKRPQESPVGALAADRCEWVDLLGLPWAADAFPDLRLAFVSGGGLSAEQTAELSWRIPNSACKDLPHPAYEAGVIVTGGHPVGPAEVASGFVDTGLVERADVTGVDDPRLGQRIRVSCTLRSLGGAEDAVDADKLRRLVARTLPPLMIPAEIEVLRG